MNPTGRSVSSFSVRRRSVILRSLLTESFRRVTHAGPSSSTQVDALLSAAGVAGGAKQVEKIEALEMNKLSVEQVKERQARLGKMRALLFYHEERAKRLKAIKSKSYRKHEATRLKMLAKKKGGATDMARATPLSWRRYCHLTPHTRRARPHSTSLTLPCPSFHLFDRAGRGGARGGAAQG